MGDKEITIESYDKTVDAYIRNTDPLHPKEEADKFLSMLEKGASILDIGCGPGRDAKIFSEKGFKVTGIDLSEKMIDAARKRCRAEFKVMDLMKLEYPDEKFDSIWAMATYLHVPKIEIVKSLKEAFRVLKRGGIFAISVKLGEGELLREDKRYGNVKKFWSFYSKPEIETALKKAGFEILESYVDMPKKAYYTNAVVRTISRKPN
jgi:ubiquinone/menaquinone biosynthesis C-methylase UbiE